MTPRCYQRVRVRFRLLGLSLFYGRRTTISNRDPQLFALESCLRKFELGVMTDGDLLRLAILPVAKAPDLRAARHHLDDEAAAICNLVRAISRLEGANLDVGECHVSSVCPRSWKMCPRSL